MGDTLGRSTGNVLIAVFGIFGTNLIPLTIYSFYAVVISIFIGLTWYFYDECQKLIYIQITTTTSLKALKKRKTKIMSKIGVGHLKADNPETGLDRKISKLITDKNQHR